MADAYQKQASSHEILTREQEVALGREIQSGLHAAAVIEEGGYEDDEGNWVEVTDRLELRRLQRVARTGNEAREAFILHNLRLALDVAAGYAKAQSRLPYDDLTQEANIGLIRAVEKFDPERGFKFSTYATWWCKQACQRAIANLSRTVRLPMHIEQEVRLVQRKIEEMESRDGYTPAMEDVAFELGKDIDEVEELWRYMATTFVSSLDEPIGEDSSLTREDTVTDEDAKSPEDYGIEAHQAQAVVRSIHLLDTKEVDILTRRHGLDGDSPKTLQQIGDDMGMTRERVRQLEAKAIAKLRHPGSGIVSSLK